MCDVNTIVVGRTSTSSRLVLLPKQHVTEHHCCNLAQPESAP